MDISPDVQAKSRFDRNAELIRFFDQYLKGLDTGIAEEPPVRYYTMVERRWKSAHSWPPAANAERYYFDANARLSKEAPVKDLGFDSYRVSYDTRTGTSARWNTLIGGGPVSYPDRRDADRDLLVYTSVPLAEDTEVTGHPEIVLHLASSTVDGQFFVYLEDVAPDGTVQYVTEGELRALHRKVTTENVPYKLVGPYHSFEREDMSLMTVGRPEILHFTMLPTSYLFKKGHAIRIALAGADIDHFAPPAFPPSTWKVFRNAAHSSHVVLPVVHNRP